MGTSMMSKSTHAMPATLHGMDTAALPSQLHVTQLLKPISGLHKMERSMINQCITLSVDD
jgi:hypothetical protein